MSTAYPGPVSAVQVGSYFVGQYYQVLQQQPDLVHQFYSEASSMIRIDGDSTDSASTMLQIHTIVMSLNFAAIEIKTINSLDSWNGCILVVVSGSVKSKDFNARRNFFQTFLLAPQEKGYFVLNDIFQYSDDGAVYQQPTPLLSESNFDTHLNSSSSPHPEPPVSDYALEEEARDYVNSVHIDDDPVDHYDYTDEQEQLEEETGILAVETHVEEEPALIQNYAPAVQETPSVPFEEHVVEPVEEVVGEPEKKTWASILRLSKGQSAPSAVTQPSYTSNPTPSDWNHTPQYVEPQRNPTFSVVPDSGVEAAEENYGFDDEDEPKSVYVRNLSPSVTEAEIELEFKNFGRIKPDGVFIRSRKDIGVCYAFVEYEDIASVHNALKASPTFVAGRQVYIEERRPNSSGVARGGRGGGRGRGRSGYPTESTRGRFGGRSMGRGNQDADYNRFRGNGFHQRGTR